MTRDADGGKLFACDNVVLGVVRRYCWMMGNKKAGIQLQNLNPFIKIAKMLLPEQLYEHIPRKVGEWTPKDVEKWFRVNNIETKGNFSFVKEKFNGPALAKATPEYLLEVCGVTSRIIMKKIFEWLEYDKEDFEEYVEEHAGSLCPQLETQIVSEEGIQDEVELEPTQRPSKQKNEILLQCLPTEKDESVSPRNICGQNQKHWAAIKPMQVQKWKKKKAGSQEPIALQRVHSSKENSKKLSNRSSNRSQKSILVGANFAKSQYECFESIIQFKFNKKLQYIANSGKIGRFTTNDIMIVDDSVSRLHAEIIKDQDEFYLKDAGSKFGTFVPVGTKNRNLLTEGDIIAFEDHQLEIIKYKFYKSNGTFDLRLRSKNAKQPISNFYGKKQITIGRQGNDIFLNEPSILPKHAKITFNQGGDLTIIAQQGQCYKKLKRDQLMLLQQSDFSLRLGLTIVQIHVISTRKSVPNISEFNFCG